MNTKQQETKPMTTLTTPRRKAPTAGERLDRIEQLKLDREAIDLAIEEETKALLATHGKGDRILGTAKQAVVVEAVRKAVDTELVIEIMGRRRARRYLVERIDQKRFILDLEAGLLPDEVLPAVSETTTAPYLAWSDR